MSFGLLVGLLSFVLLNIQFGNINGIEPCPDGKFGPRCSYSCHCAKGTTCDALGACPSGCAHGWSGKPHCHMVNIAGNRTTSQHGTYLGWESDRAVDGNRDQDGTYGSCAWAFNQNDVFKTWWNVNLGRQYTVRNIKVFFRTDDARSQARRAGVRVYISDSVTTANSSGLCFSDKLEDFALPGAQLDLSGISLQCSIKKGKFVILYVERPVRTPNTNCPTTRYSCWANLELCEVEIYSCANGTYDELCDKHCNCKNNVSCDQQSGMCPGGICQIGWTGPKCDQECSPGTYGEGCFQTCGHCQGTCDPITGVCTSGCKPGYQGEKCIAECDPGRYGSGCSALCGHCVGTCEPVTGMCTKGCDPGWIGSHCTDACEAGFYGNNCQSKCGKCADDTPCDHVTGTCEKGCAPGYAGSNCDLTCANGYYGNGCETKCGACLADAICHHITGICPGTCEAGFMGQSCDQSCIPGKYGKDCLNDCGSCKDGAACDVLNGACQNGCMPGWTGSLCKQACETGTYGIECNKMCGRCLDDEACDHVTGVCPSGCTDGYHLQNCSQECTDGMYGKQCTQTCGSCRKHKPCDHIDGKCPGACASGWLGDRCDKGCIAGTYGLECKETCGFCKNGTVCNHVDGFCPSGCETGYYGELCVLSLTQVGKDTGMSGPLLSAGDMSAIIGGTMAGILIVFFAILATVFFKRRRKPPRNPPQQDSSQPPSRSSTMRSQHSTHTRVELVQNDDRNHANGGHGNPGKSHSSPVSTIRSDDIDKPEVVIDDQEVLYLNVKNKKTPIPLPVPVPSPQLSSFQRSRTPNLGIEERLYYNMTEDLRVQSEGVTVDQFLKYIKEKETSEHNFRTEFESLPHGAMYPHEAGKRIRNKFKNRFAQTFPYDHSRVILEEEAGDSDSNYINANYIDSVDCHKSYIATQGPNRATVNDFWRMVWQKNAGKIIMLTNLVEETKTKCELYWPERGRVSAGSIWIELKHVQYHPFFVLRTLEIFNCQEAETRTIRQFHFTTWPDHGVPDVFELVCFFRCVTRIQTTLSGPLIVHCSAGVGRTGTFIALDALYHYGKHGNKIDVIGFVRRMRQQRMNMIQTIDQYRLLHYALHEAFSHPTDSVISKLSFVSECHKGLHNQQLGHQNRITEEFEKLQSLQPKYSNDHYVSALKKENVEKNRNINILAAEKYRPYLSTYIPDTNDYINAVTVPSYSKRSGYIITQLPIKNTVVDFWRMMYDHNSPFVVVLNALDEDLEDSCAWWPAAGEPVTFGPLRVDTVAVDSLRDEVTERVFNLYKKGDKESRMVRMLTYNHWYPGAELPSSLESFLLVVSKVNMWGKSCGDQPITVLCLDGATCCGVLVAICNLIEQIQMHDEADIFSAVRQIQIRRPEAVKSKDQYCFIYRTIANSIDTGPIYSNVAASVH